MRYKISKKYTIGLTAIPINGSLIASMKLVNGFKYTKLSYCPSLLLSHKTGVSSKEADIIALINKPKSLNLAHNSEIKKIIQYPLTKTSTKPGKNSKELKDIFKPAK